MYVMDRTRAVKDAYIGSHLSKDIMERVWDKVEERMGLRTVTWHYCNDGWIGDVK